MPPGCAIMLIVMNKRFANSTQKAFTVVEMIVVIIVLAILVGMVSFGYSGWRDRMVETELRNDAEMISASLDSEENWRLGYPAVFPESIKLSPDAELQQYEAYRDSICMVLSSKVRPDIAKKFEVSSEGLMSEVEGDECERTTPRLMTHDTRPYGMTCVLVAGSYYSPVIHLAWSNKHDSTVSVTIEFPGGAKSVHTVAPGSSLTITHTPVLANVPLQPGGIVTASYVLGGVDYKEEIVTTAGSCDGTTFVPQ